MFSQVKTILLYSMQSCLKAFSINLLVVYRESVNLIGYTTRRLSADPSRTGLFLSEIVNVWAIKPFLK